MEIGEKVTDVSEFFSGAEHDETTCPWHTLGDTPPTQEMLPQEPDDDAETPVPLVGEGALVTKMKAAKDLPPRADKLLLIPETDGGVLGKKMKSSEDLPPAVDMVSLHFETGDVIEQASKRVRTQTYNPHEDAFSYDLQYAPHHLIPGNESLKGSAVVPFMGDDNSIKNYTSPRMTSRIKPGHSIGYDVNAAENGVWLPSPYALSNKKLWPTGPGLAALLKSPDKEIGKQTTLFKLDYVAAAIEASGGRQFHMRHKPYSDKVRQTLQSIGERLQVMADEACPLAKASKDQDKCAPPLGLTARLNLLSENLRGLLTKSVWRPPLYTDSLTEEYANTMVATGRFPKTHAKGSITQIF
ncbi:AHH domain-containing protein [Myxococcus sp. CA056]|uniref:AHH domain-containing protein n=1 Tax=Myxococcus sp. CA056 TaxID=2741740 RepID=UPI00157B97D3|nr:AHH domain-containing protein [Myxococcus sp. CA056]NTX17799.1 AHH domain-containing protein [Myxococcus sp. CA056]